MNLHEFRNDFIERPVTIEEVDDYCINNYYKSQMSADDFVVAEDTIKQLNKLNYTIQPLLTTEHNEDTALLKRFYNNFVDQADKYVDLRINHKYQRSASPHENKEQIAAKVERTMHNNHENIYLSFYNLISLATEETNSFGQKFTNDILNILHKLKLSDKIDLKDNSPESQQKFMNVLNTLTTIESSILNFPERASKGTSEDEKNFIEGIEDHKNYLKQMGLSEGDISSFKYAVTSLAVRSSYLRKHAEFFSD